MKLNLRLKKVDGGVQSATEALAADQAPPLTPSQIQLVKETWEAAAALGATNVGVILFRNIFTLAPGVLPLFRFRDEEDLYASPALRKHATGVVATVGAAVGLLEDLDTLVPILQDLGARHVPRGVKAEYYPVVG